MMITNYIETINIDFQLRFNYNLQLLLHHILIDITKQPIYIYHLRQWTYTNYLYISSISLLTD